MQLGGERHANTWQVDRSASGLGDDPGWTAEGDQENAYFGISVGTAGDVNGDGFDEVIVGSPTYYVDQRGDGMAIVFHGRPMS